MSETEKFVDLQQKQVYFLHIPKTAGTTFRHFLDEQFQPKEILGPQVWNYLLPQMPQDWGRFRLIRGHYGYSLLRLLPEKPFLMTFLRDPVERILSQFHHMFKDPNRNNWVRANEVKRSLRGFLDECPQYLSNNQTRYLAHDLPVIQNAALSTRYYLYDSDPEFLVQKSDQLEIAKNRLTEEFDFIGITEQFDRSVQRLCALTGWEYRDLKARNVNASRWHRENYPVGMIERIEELNQDDIELYQFLLRKYA